MSTRWYPRYVLGNPQLRIFLPDFWMILKKPKDPLPPNQVEFKIPVHMTKWDVKNYLEKIYKIPVINVCTQVVCGDIKKAEGKAYLVKGQDYKRAVVDLPKEMKFEFPNLYSEGKDRLSEDIKDMESELEFGKIREIRKNYKNRRHNVPNWFGI